MLSITPIVVARTFVELHCELDWVEWFGFGFVFLCSVAFFVLA